MIFFLLEVTKIISCPSCARQAFEVIKTVEILEQRLSHIKESYKVRPQKVDVKAQPQSRAILAPRKKAALN